MRRMGGMQGGSSRSSLEDPPVTLVVGTVTIRNKPVIAVDTDPSIQLGVDVNATGFCGGGLITGRTTTWQSSNPSVASISGSGLVDLLTAGTTVISCTVDSVTDSFTLTVNSSGSPPVATTVVISPGFDFSLNVGQTQNLSAVTKDNLGNIIAGRTHTWSTTNASLANVHPTTGVVTAVAAGGPVTITATDAINTGLTDTVSVTVFVPSNLHKNEPNGATLIVDNDWSTIEPTNKTNSVPGQWNWYLGNQNGIQLRAPRAGMRGVNCAELVYLQGQLGGRSPSHYRYQFINPPAGFTRWDEVYHHFQIELLQQNEGSPACGRDFALPGNFSNANPGTDPNTGLQYTGSCSQIKLYWTQLATGTTNGPFLEFKPGPFPRLQNTVDPICPTTGLVLRFNMQATAAGTRPQGDPLLVDSYSANVNTSIPYNLQDYLPHDIEIWQKAQTAPGSLDGRLKIWIDNILRFDHSNVEWLGSSSLRSFGGVKLEHQFGGWANPPIQHQVPTNMGFAIGAVYISGIPGT